MFKDNQNIYVGVLIFIILGFFVGYYFLFQYGYALGQTVYDLKQETEQDSRQRQEIQQSLAALGAITPQLQEIDSYFIGPDGEVPFIDSLEARAQSLQLKTEITSVQIEKSKNLAPKKLEYLTLRLKVNGSWKNVYTFISLLQNIPYQVTLDQVDLTASVNEERPQGTTWQATSIIKILKKTKNNQ